MTEIKQYRKKPVVIEAVRFCAGERGNFNDIVNWTKARQWFADMDNADECYFYISTSEGRVIVRNGDYIIRDVKGEFYLCKPDIFEQTYEEVEK